MLETLFLQLAQMTAVWHFIFKFAKRCWFIKRDDVYENICKRNINTSVVRQQSALSYPQFPDFLYLIHFPSADLELWSDPDFSE